MPLAAACMVYAAQPREGTETYLHSDELPLSYAVYAAQPREGTETHRGQPRPLKCPRHRFMQLNPARGRKLAPSAM